MITLNLRSSLSVACSSCQDQVAETRFNGEPVCSNCGYWMAKKKSVDEKLDGYFYTDDWSVFFIGEPGLPPKQRGCGGQMFLVTLAHRPLAPICSDNLWHNGVIPVHMRGGWPGEHAKMIRI